MRGAGRALVGGVIAAAAIGAVLSGEPQGRDLVPDTSLQAAIDGAITAIVRQDSAARERVDTLRSLAAGRRPAMLLQLALSLEGSTGTEQSMAGAILLRELAFTPREIVESVVPHLDTDRPALLAVLTGMLGTIDRREGGDPDFRVYDSWLAAHRGAPTPALVRYLFETSPDEALACMRRVYGGGGEPNTSVESAIGDLNALADGRDASRAWTARERGRATAALETLSRDPAWWMRLYAAEFLSRDRDLGTPAILKRLQTDPDPLVRDALAVP